MKSILLLVYGLFAVVGIAFASDVALPTHFDLRIVGGKNFVSSVKYQSGGTCWTHGTMAAIESNLMFTDAWANAGQTGEAALAEYHLDWWNGFNQYFNADTAPNMAGLTVHEGGDYRVAAAYLARGGAVRDVDGQSFENAPKETDSSYRLFYVRDIEWLNAGSDLSSIDQIKHAILENGAIGSALAYSGSFYSTSLNSHYQPPSSGMDPNHAVAIVGWDDSRVTQAPKPGAWLTKNSWGSGWGDGGYFWMSYYDKVAGHHPEMGAVSFRNSELMGYNRVYSHDYHGWRDTKKDADEAFNKFVAKGNASGVESVEAVSFYTASNNVSYSVKVYGAFKDGELQDQLSIKEGVEEKSGFHTVDLGWPVQVKAGDSIYVYVRLSQGGHAFDRTSNVPVLLGSRGRVTVPSKANAGESYYRSGLAWKDLTLDNSTANFCIKALSFNR